MHKFKTVGLDISMLFIQQRTSVSESKPSQYHTLHVHDTNSSGRRRLDYQTQHQLRQTDMWKCLFRY